MGKRATYATRDAVKDIGNLLLFLFSWVFIIYSSTKSSSPPDESSLLYILKELLNNLRDNGNLVYIPVAIVVITAAHAIRVYIGICTSTKGNPLSDNNLEKIHTLFIGAHLVVVGVLLFCIDGSAIIIAVSLTVHNVLLFAYWQKIYPRENNPLCVLVHPQQNIRKEEISYIVAYLGDILSFIMLILIWALLLLSQVGFGWEWTVILLIGFSSVYALVAAIEFFIYFLPLCSQLYRGYKRMESSK